MTYRFDIRKDYSRPPIHAFTVKDEYNVRINAQTGESSCTCLGFTYSQNDCKHIKQCKKLIEKCTHKKITNSLEHTRTLNRRLLSHSFLQRAHKNLVNISAANGPKHETKKTEICLELKKLGKHFYTEAEFHKTQARADIFILDDGIAIEIMDSETTESIYDKRKRYPCPLEVVHVNEQFEPNKIFRT